MYRTSERKFVCFIVTDFSQHMIGKSYDWYKIDLSYLDFESPKILMANRVSIRQLKYVNLLINEMHRYFCQNA